MRIKKKRILVKKSGIVKREKKSIMNTKNAGTAQLNFFHVQHQSFFVQQYSKNEIVWVVLFGC